MRTSTRGRPTAWACARSSTSRTPCIETRANSSVIVVRRAVISRSGRTRATPSANALSFPELHDIQARRRVVMGSRGWGAQGVLGGALVGGLHLARPETGLHAVERERRAAVAPGELR